MVVYTILDCNLVLVHLTENKFKWWATPAWRKTTIVPESKEAQNPYLFGQIQILFLLLWVSSFAHMDSVVTGTSTSLLQDMTYEFKLLAQPD